MSVLRPVVAALVGVSLLASPLAAAPSTKAAPKAALPLPSAAGYRPQDKLEEGLWFEMDEQERLLRQSKFLFVQLEPQPLLELVLRAVTGGAG